MIAYKLDKSISAEKIIGEINKLIQINQENIQNKLLIIDIKTITNDDTSLIPKLTYQNHET